MHKRDCKECAVYIISCEDCKSPDIGESSEANGCKTKLNLAVDKVVAELLELSTEEFYNELEKSRGNEMYESILYAWRKHFSLRDE